MPETMSIERRKVLKALGANLVLTEGAPGMAGAISKAEEIVASDPGRYVLLQQFKNPANPEIHFRTTGPEIWDDTDGAVDVLCPASVPAAPSAVSRATSRRLRARRFFPWGSSRKTARSSPSSSRANPLKPGPHKIQGIGAGFIPDTLDLSMVDRVELVTNEESIEMARRLAKEEGILAGYLLRRCRGRRRPAGPAARVCGKDHRDRAARFRRALPEYRCCSKECSRNHQKKKRAHLGDRGECARCRNGDLIVRRQFPTPTLHSGIVL